MRYQNLFNALQNVCAFTALQSDMLEIINAYEKDKAEQLLQKPYLWCNVYGCDNKGTKGGCWRETGYWTVCLKHATQWSKGKPQPQMKRSAIDREKRRCETRIAKIIQADKKHKQI